MELKLGYISLSLLMTLVLVVIDSKATKRSAAKAPVKLLFVLLGWHLYLYLLSCSGFIANLDFPPRFVFLTILPAFIFVGWFAKKAKNGRWLFAIPSHWLVFYQSFRILIETLFVFTVSAGLLHANVTIEGYNFDMIYALTAPIAGWLVMKGNYKFGLYWNYLGLLVIASILILFQLTIFAPQVFGPNTAPFPPGFLQYPYILVPAFLMPSAVFIHVLSIVQLRKKLAEATSQ